MRVYFSSKHKEGTFDYYWHKAGCYRAKGDTRKAVELESKALSLESRGKTILYGMHMELASEARHYYQPEIKVGRLK